MKMYIARNKRGELCLSALPLLYDNEKDKWYSGCGVFTRLYRQCFPEVIFENSPQKVEIKLI